MLRRCRECCRGRMDAAQVWRLLQRCGSCCGVSGCAMEVDGVEVGGAVELVSLLFFLSACPLSVYDLARQGIANTKSHLGIKAAFTWFRCEFIKLI